MKYTRKYSPSDQFDKLISDKKWVVIISNVYGGLTFASAELPIPVIINHIWAFAWYFTLDSVVNTNSSKIYCILLSRSFCVIKIELGIGMDINTGTVVTILQGYFNKSLQKFSANLLGAEQGLSRSGHKTIVIVLTVNLNSRCTSLLLWQTQ